MNPEPGQNKGEDPVYDRLPPDVKREFMQKRLQQEMRDKAFQAELRKRTVKGTIIGAVVGLILGFIIQGSAVAFFIILAVTEAAASYIIVRRQPGHLVCMALGAGSAIVVSVIFIGLGQIPWGDVWTFIKMVASWGSFLALGGILGVWSRNIETDTYQGNAY